MGLCLYDAKATSPRLSMLASSEAMLGKEICGIHIYKYLFTSESPLVKLTTSLKQAAL